MARASAALRLPEAEVAAVPPSLPAAGIDPAVSTAAKPTERALTRRDWIGFLCMVFGMFMAILDIQIVASSLSEIQAGISASADEISWVQTSYLIAEVIMIPLSGYLSRLLSTRVLFVISATGFTVASLMCALSSSIGAMIVFRATQGFIGGAMIPTVFATAFTLFPERLRPTVGVMIGLVATMAPTLGPTLGGYLTQAFSWHWLFLVNIVPGLFVATTVWFLVDIDRPDRSLLRGLDIPGVVLMALFLGSLEYVVEEGARNDWLNDDTIALFAAVSAVAGVLFFWRVLTYRQPIVDLRAFADRNFALGSLFSFCLGIGLYGSVYLLPLFMAQVRGYNSLQIGLVMIVTGACQFLSAPIAGILSKKLDLRIVLAMGLSLFGLGAYLNSFLTADSAFWELFLPQAVRGSSLMLCFLPINTLALGTLPPEKLKNASGLYNLTRNLGGAIGLAVINTILIERLAVHQTRLAEQITAARPGVQALIDGLSQRMGDRITGDADLAAWKVLSILVRREATVLTFNDALLMMSAVFFCAMLLMPFVRKPRAMVGGGH